MIPEKYEPIKSDYVPFEWVECIAEKISHRKENHIIIG